MKDSIQEEQWTAPATGSTTGYKPSVEKVTDSDGQIELKLRLYRISQGELRFVAWPLAKPDKAQLVVRFLRPCPDCQPRLAVDGAALTALEATGAHDGKSLELSLESSVLGAIAGSGLTTLRVGKDDWQFTAQEKAAVGELVKACRQEQALSGEPTKAEAKDTPSDDL